MYVSMWLWMVETKAFFWPMKSIDYDVIDVGLGGKQIISPFFWNPIRAVTNWGRYSPFFPQIDKERYIDM